MAFQSTNGISWVFVLFLFTLGSTRLWAYPPRLPVPMAAGLQHAAQLVAGEQHTCAITDSGGVKCWGDNYYGQLGDGGVNPNTATPVEVVGLAGGVSALTAGDYHTCALLSGGGVKCWGRNSFGQLGDNTTEAKSTPLTPGNLTSGVLALAAGRDHTCAVTGNGGVQCWGLNNGGQLGDGTLDGRSTPVTVVGLSSGVSALAAGNLHTCALTSSGGVKCWGRNPYGQLGDGTTQEHLTPVDVPSLSSGVTALTVGYDHSCALLESGSVKCWGRNDAGQLGDGTTVNRAAPVEVVDLSSSVRVIAAAAAHTCVITNANTVQCWGDNAAGQLGDGTVADHSRPTNVAGLTNAGNALATGVWHSCVAISDGSVNCWGWNGAGQLGEGAFPTRLSPVDVVGLSSASTATAGGAHTCAVTSSGGAKCWGKNFYGQLGDNTGDSRMMPVDVSGLSSGVGELAAGAMHSCALTTTGAVQCWGRNDEGQLGNNDTVSSPTPVAVVGLSSGVSLIAAGDYHTCAVIGGGVRCWGQNDYGQVGDGTTTNRSTPVEVISPGSGVSATAAGLWHTCAVISGGAVQCWGKNENGQLGDGTTINHTTPVTVSGLSGVKAIAAGSWHTCAVMGAGGVKCWGRGTGGQTETTPVDVAGVSDVRTLGAGKYHTCALTNNGAVQCWGGNIYGQLGNGTMTDSSSVVETVGLSSGITALAGGELHNCAVTGGGGIKCWGSNYEGQLGDGTAWRTTPVTVVSLTVAPSTATATPSPTATDSPGATLTPTVTPQAAQPYEPNDDCAHATAIATDGAAQTHNFHSAGDIDWVRFAAKQGGRYLVEAITPADSTADLVLEVYTDCGTLNATQAYTYTADIRLEFTAPLTGTLFFKLANDALAVAGSKAQYLLAVRPLDNVPSPTASVAIIVAGSLGPIDGVIGNIYHASDAMHALFIKQNYSPDRIAYLAPNPGHPNVDKAATKANLQEAITQWAVSQVGGTGALTLYIIDHGTLDQSIYLNKQQNEWVTPEDLQSWLTAFETAHPNARVNVIIEACYGGAFINDDRTVSKAGRVVITSTSDRELAWAQPGGGARFSDQLIAALTRKSSLLTSFKAAQAAAVAFQRTQIAWLDANGNGIPNEAADETIAAQRGFDLPGSFGAEWPPYIARSEQPTAISNGEGVVRAEVVDDGAVKHVWAMIYPPHYTTPPASEALVNDETDERVTKLGLTLRSDGRYSANFTGFKEPGTYRVVIYAEDEQGLSAQPVVLEVINGSQLFLTQIAK